MSETKANYSRKNADRFELGDSNIKAEILWSIYTTISLLGSLEGIIPIMKQMFPKSIGLRDFKMEEDKRKYIIFKGLVPYFRDTLKELLKDSPFLALHIEEKAVSINQKQMDIYIRFWKKEKIETRYLDSALLPDSCSDDFILGHFKNILHGVDCKKIIHISCGDRKVRDILMQEIQQFISPCQLLNTGPCVLRWFNVSFEKGIWATKWNLVNFLELCYDFFGSALERRNFVLHTNCKEFPIAVTKTQWIKYHKAAKKIKLLIHNLKMYINLPTNQKYNFSQFKLLKTCLNDNLIPAKLEFFQSLAEELDAFLEPFETFNSVNAPFLYSDLQIVLKNIMNRFVRQEVLDALTENDLTYNDLINENEIYLDDVTTHALTESGPSDRDISLFKKSCRDCLLCFINNIRMRFLLKSNLTNALAFLDPKQILDNKNIALNNMVQAFNIIFSFKWITSHEIFKADSEFRNLISNKTVIEKLKNYSRKKERLETFWMSIVEDSRNLKNMLQILFLASCRHSMVSREVPVHEAIDPDMKTIVAHMIINDSIKNIGGIDNFEIDNKLISIIQKVLSSYQKNKILSAKRKAEKEAAMELEIKRKRQEIDNLEQELEKSRDTHTG